MLEVVPGSSNTGTVIRYGNLKSSMLYGCYVEKENVDIDLVQFNLFFYVRKGLCHL